MKYNTDILDGLPIVDVARALGIEILRGNKAICFKGHDKNTPSLSFNISSNYYNCFGCGIGGKCISLVKERFNCNFQDACEWLSNKFNVGSDCSTFRKEYVYHPKVNLKKSIDFKPDPEVYEWIINSTTLSKEGYRYCTEERKFSSEIVEQFNIKVIDCPQAFFNIVKKEFKIDRLIKCGLVREGDVHKFLWWRPVLIFPFYNLKNQIDYLQGRHIFGDKPKYVNLNGVGTTVFNLNVISRLKAGDRLYITEGVPDAISLSQRGKNAIGIMGANNFKHEYVNFLKDFSLFVIPDNDAGGEQFYQNVKNSFKGVGKTVKRVGFSLDCKDVSDYLAKYDV